MSRLKEIKPLLTQIDYKELGQAVIATMITLPTVVLLEQTTRVDVPFDSKVLIAGIYFALALGMTYMGLIHTNRALRKV